MDCREAAWNIDTIVKCSMTASLLLLAGCCSHDVRPATHLAILNRL